MKPETLAALRALCPHGGDESLRNPGPGRTGICDACAAKLYEEHVSMQAVVRDAAEERGYKAFLLSLGQVTRAARIYASRNQMSAPCQVHLTRLQWLERQLTEVSGPLPPLTPEQRWYFGDGDAHLQADGEPCAYAPTVDGCTRCGWQLTETLKADEHLMALVRARAREQFSPEHAARYRHLSPGSACGIAGCVLHPGPRRVLPEPACTGDGREPCFVFDCPRHHLPASELPECPGGAACPTTGRCPTHG